MVSTVEIHQATQEVIIDGVSFNAPFAESSILGGHPHGPVFSHGSARAVISEKDATLLVTAGVVDRR